MHDQFVYFVRNIISLKTRLYEKSFETIFNKFYANLKMNCINSNAIK